VPGEVWFWQRTVSPHMAGLAAALAQRGVSTTYVAEGTLTEDRIKLGWELSSLGDARLLFAPDDATAVELISQAARDSLHICQGLRANGVVAAAQRALAARRLRQCVVMEGVDDRGWKGWLRRGLYAWLVLTQRSRIRAFLATGAGTAEWLVARGAPADAVFPFGYFLAEARHARPARAPCEKSFRVLFVGQFVERKRLDLLINALAIIGSHEVELVVVGSGPLEQELRALAELKLGPRVSWLGVRAHSEVPAIMASADCLVLPSRFDGWGAVASEALLAGTPVVCSDKCGCREVVRLGGGNVFAEGDAQDLQAALDGMIRKGPPSPAERERLTRWAAVLGAEAGAAYLEEILIQITDGGRERPEPPWLRTASPGC
jgi:glycosyltransferase involved in cell wall biosynthesis